MLLLGLSKPKRHLHREGMRRRPLKEKMEGNNNQLSNHLYYSLNNSFKGKALLLIDTKTSELKGNGVTYIHMMISEYCSPWY